MSPDKDFLGHQKRDVLPYLACCKFSDNCAKYYQMRPSDDGSRYVSPPVGEELISLSHEMQPGLQIRHFWVSKSFLLKIFYQKENIVLVKIFSAFFELC